MMAGKSATVAWQQFLPDLLLRCPDPQFLLHFPSQHHGQVGFEPAPSEIGSKVKKEIVEANQNYPNSQLHITFSKVCCYPAIEGAYD